MNDPRQSELWPAFETFAGENGISLGCVDDWRPWWDCFLAGRDAYVDTLDGGRWVMEVAGGFTLAEGSFMYIDLVGCARCRGNHTHVLFRQLSNPADDWKWWGACPVKDEPVLLKVVETK